MTPMTLDGKSTPKDDTLAALRKLAQWRLVRFVVWARWFISIGLTLIALLSSAYILGQDISLNLTNDYKAVQTAQSTLVLDAQKLRDDLLNPNVDVALETELQQLRDKSLATISTLGSLRAPSDKIEIAKQDYRDALQQLIGVANRMSRGAIAGMAGPLATALQNTANTGGYLNIEISYFQGGMWPQLWAAVF
jgi:hypothetical protein